jgi:hypothetical protein
MAKKLKPISEMSKKEFFAHYGVAGMRWGDRKPGRPTTTSSTKRADPYRRDLDYDYLLPGGGPKAADPKVAAVNAIKRIEAISEETEEESSDEKEPKKAAAAPATDTAELAKLNGKIKEAQKEVDALTDQMEEEQTALRSQMARESFKAEILRQVSRYFVTGKAGDTGYGKQLQEASSARIKEHQSKAKQIEAEAKKRKEAWDSSIGEAQAKVTEMEDKRDKMSHGDERAPLSGKLKAISKMSRDEITLQFGGHHWNARHSFRTRQLEKR